MVPQKTELETVEKIEEVEDKLNQELDEQQKSVLKEKQLVDQVEVKDSVRPLITDNLVKSQSLDESHLPNKSHSMVIDNILRLHSSQKSLKEGNGATTKPIVFPSLVTGPAAGQASETATPEVSSTKRSSNSSIRDSAFYSAAQKILKFPRKPTPGRSPPPGCGPSFSSGPGSLRDVRIRNDSRSPSPKKSVFTTIRGRDYGNTMSFWNRSPRRNTVSSVKPADETQKKLSKGQRKPYPGRSPPPGCGTFSPGSRSPRETSRTELVSPKEPESNPPAEIKEDNPALKNETNSEERKDDGRDEQNPTAIIPKLPRPPIDDGSKDSNESEMENRLRSSLERKLPNVPIKNRYVTESESEFHRQSRQRGPSLERRPSVVADQMVLETEDPPFPKTQSTATQYDPMLTSMLMEDQQRYLTIRTKRPHSISHCRFDESAGQLQADDRNSVHEENRRRSHSESATKRCNEAMSAQRIPTQRSAPRPARQDPNLDPYEDRPTREEIRVRRTDVKNDRSFYPSLIYDETPPEEHDEEIRQRTNKRQSTSTDSSGRQSRSHRTPEQDNERLRELKEYARHRHSTDKEKEVPEMREPAGLRHSTD
uniref:Uncharacterized protein n=1 Tax=Lygus hesperus TaxID=30085 RepID=A0A0A9WQV3_LYGHE